MKMMDRPFKILDNASQDRIRSRYSGSQCKLSPLKSFLRTANLEGMYSILKENQVSLQDLPLITREDLVDLEVPIGPRNRLLKAVQSLDQETIDQQTNDYEEALEGTGKFGFQDEMKCSQNKYDQLEELVLQLSRKQTQMMQLIEENQKAISDLVMAMPTQSSRDSREETVEPSRLSRMSSQAMETGGRNSSHSKAALSRFTKISPLRITYKHQEPRHELR
mmetsp:Transcript_26311/g.47164  ORF Transcript_26311/g.47164 Transcript_26311/m.47164 type:complete len:221 (-) Transcript_26311:2162-2824(-)